MDFLRGAVSGRIVSSLTAGMFVLAACGPAAQQAAPTSAPAAPTTGAAATSAPAAAAQPTAAAKPPSAPAPTIAPAAATAKQGGRGILGEFAAATTLNPTPVTAVPPHLAPNH